ncbi:MAG: cysteine desulfurase [Desulfobacteraceae bacterium]|nr:cysteine desulfurase [Desulfobacteraceae bacterium]
MAFDPRQIMKAFPILESGTGKNTLHYLDNAATAQVPNAVINAMVAHDAGRRANVKRGIHRLAESATAAYENARESVARFIGVQNPAEIIFTSGTTHGINLLAHSLGNTLKPGDEILLSPVEHHSNLVPWQMLQDRFGIHINFLPMDDNGLIDTGSITEYITPRTRIVSLSHGSNVTGALTDTAALGDAVHEHGAVLILDGAQVIPHGPVDLPALKADFYVFSGHKAYGPSGIGVLWGRMEQLEKVSPVFSGGEMIGDVKLLTSTYAEIPHRFEAGTPPITQAVGLGAALDWLHRLDQPGLNRHLMTLTTQVINGLQHLSVESNAIRIIHPAMDTGRLPIISFIVRGIHPHDVCQFLSDRYDIALRGGFHCAQPLHEQLGLPEGSTRVSLAAFNTQEDVDILLEGIAECMRILL